MDIDHGTIARYVKPLVKDQDVYDARQDRDKDLWHTLYEGVIEHAAALLRNSPRNEIATKADLSRPDQGPSTRHAPSRGAAHSHCLLRGDPTRLRARCPCEGTD